MDLSQIFPKHAEQMEAEMREIVESRTLPLYRMMSYHLGWIDEHGSPYVHSSKERTRAILCLLACEAAGGEMESALPSAVALELVHNFALIHSDLQDGKPQHMGRDAVWWVWGPAQAINAGDGMHALARLSLFRLKEKGASDETVFRSLQLLDEASLQLCEGQFLDISYQERIDVGVQSYLKMIEKKSGALMGCAGKLGALSASASDRVIDALGTFGAKLGMALQIREDVLALWGNRREGGFPSSEILNKRKTLPVVYGLEKAGVKDKRQLGEVYFKRVLEPQDVERIVAVLDGLNAKEYSQQTAEGFYQEALMALEESGLPAEATGDLREAARILVQSEG